MIRFIDLTNQINEEQPAFAWFNTATSNLLSFNGKQIWETWEEFLLAYKVHIGHKPSLERLQGLFPKSWKVLSDPGQLKIMLNNIIINANNLIILLEL